MAAKNAAQIQIVPAICQHGFLSLQGPSQVKNHQRMQLRKADLEVEVAVGRHKRGFVLGNDFQQAVNHFPGAIRQLLSANQFLFRQFALRHKGTFFQRYLGMVT